jgi:hypothetical protein
MGTDTSNQGNGRPTQRFTSRLQSKYGIVEARHVAQTLAGTGHDPSPGSGTTFTDNGGQKLDHIQVQLIFWGAAWKASPQPVPTAAEVDAAVDKIMQSTYMSALAQYGVGSGTRLASLVVSTSNPPNAFTDADVVNFIIGLLNTDQLSEPDENSQILYCVVMPVGASSASTSFIGEHSFFSYMDEEDPSRFDNAHFAWITNAGSLASLTTIFSHELVESCTDPEGTGILGVAGTCSQSGWCEIGDVCTSTGVVNGVTVQSYWSQADEACIIPRGSPWYRLVNLVLAHEPDPAWLIALWLAIHGGDPVPSVINQFVTLNVLSSLANGVHDHGVRERLHEVLAPALREYQKRAENEGGESDAAKRLSEERITAFADIVRREAKAIFRGQP